MRTLGVAFVLVIVLGAAPAATAKSIHVDWREQKELADGGALKFRITKAVATTTQWAITATIENASDSPVGIDRDGMDVPPVRLTHPLWFKGIALISSHRVLNPNTGGRFAEWWQHLPSAFRPTLPATLGPHRSWTGTFGGKAKLRKGQRFSIGFGLFQLQSAASGGATVFWITDHSFAL
jgi:hypothetical protein